VFGDISGGSSIGDGTVSASDALKILQHLDPNVDLTLTDWAALAADANHDGYITSADSDLILNHSVHAATIIQNYVLDVPDYCYYGDPVAF
jgi:hypothetical protein